MTPPALIITREGHRTLATHLDENANVAEFSKVPSSDVVDPPPLVTQSIAHFSHVEQGQRVFMENAKGPRSRAGWLVMTATSGMREHVRHQEARRLIAEDCGLMPDDAVVWSMLDEAIALGDVRHTQRWDGPGVTGTRSD